ncbi:hypothetical protein AGMMS49525_01480 [Bacteroidia bacterium]|nr:hypothetical protein AGMMS49525_01480 [Bacteroidia bacterium]
MNKKINYFSLLGMLKIRRHLMYYLYLYSGVYVSTKGHLSFRKYWTLKKQQRLYKKQALNSAAQFPITKLEVYYGENEADAGTLCAPYFFQDLYVAQRIHQNKPEKHVDIGSRIDGFVAHVASYRPIEIYDIRPMKEIIPNVQFQQCDLMNLSEEHLECTDSISSLHALEHFGLGRYGDDICHDGYLLGFMNIYRMLKQDGKFYFSVPMGQQQNFMPIACFR